MWNSGIIQGLMWRTYSEDNTLVYSFVDTLLAMYPYYIARAFGGFLFLLGAIVASYNVWMTVYKVPALLPAESDKPLPVGGYEETVASPAE